MGHEGYGEGYYLYRESTLDFRVEAGLIGRLLSTFPGCRVLEVGCGGGALMRSLAARGCQVTGVDVSEEAVRLASRAAEGCETLQADACALPFGSGSFDRVVAHHLIEHLEDPVRALREWARVLRDDGILVICTPNRLYPSPRIFDDPTHVHVYERKELCRLVEESGFQVLESFTVFPHLMKDRISVKVGVPLHFLFRYLPPFAERGRSILLAARKPPSDAKRRKCSTELSDGETGDEPSGPRVLVVNHAVELGGAEKVLLRLTDHLLARGFELGLACPSEGPLPEEMLKRGVRVHLGHPHPRLLRIRRKSLGGGTSALFYPLDFAVSVIRLASLIRREGYDVVLTNSVKADIYGSMAGKVSGRPVLWRFHDIPDRQAFSRLNLFLIRAFSIAFADRVLVVSEAARRAFLALGVPEERVRTVYNGMDLRGEIASADPAGVREALGVPRDAPLAVWVGRVVDWKGTDRFVAAAATVAERLPEARFLVVGDALFGDRDYMEGLREEVARRGLRERIVFTGFRDDALNIMAASDLLVHSSLLPDPLPTVILEAMALGKPVVAFRGGGVEEMVVSGRTGLLVDAGDTEGLARAMERFLSSPEEAAEMGRRGAERFQDLFTVDSTYQVIVDELQFLARKGRGGWRLAPSERAPSSFPAAGGRDASGGAPGRDAG